MKKIRLPIKFRANLLERFTYPENTKQDNLRFVDGLGLNCQLCLTYGNKPAGSGCLCCPIYVSTGNTCSSVLLQIVGDDLDFTALAEGPIFWKAHRSKEVRKQFKKIRRALRGRVEWYEA